VTGGGAGPAALPGRDRVRGGEGVARRDPAPVGRTIAKAYERAQAYRRVPWLRFPPHPGIRSVIRVDLSRVADSCGYAVPPMSLEGERDVLDLHNAKRGPRKLADYRMDRNAASIDGLPAWPLDEPVVP
jgi:hypothetical protein